MSMAISNSPDWFTEILPLGEDTTTYRLVTTEGIETVETPLGTMLKVSTESVPADAAAGQGITVLPLRAFGDLPARGGALLSPGTTSGGNCSAWRYPGLEGAGARAGRGPQTTKPNKPTMRPSTSSPKAVWIQRFIDLLVAVCLVKDRSPAATARHDHRVRSRTP